MINTAIIMGRLTADLELKSTPSGIYVTSFSVAVERGYKSGEERAVDFINVVAWRSAAEFVCKYFTKGQMIAVQGSIRTRNYEDNQGVKRTATEIAANQISFCGSKSENGKNTASSAEPENELLPERKDEPKPFRNAPPEDFEEIIEDDLPF